MRSPLLHALGHASAPSRRRRDRRPSARAASRAARAPGAGCAARSSRCFAAMPKRMAAIDRRRAALPPLRAVDATQLREAPPRPAVEAQSGSKAGRSIWLAHLSEPWPHASRCVVSGCEAGVHDSLMDGDRDPLSHLPPLRGHLRARDHDPRRARSSASAATSDDAFSRGYICPKGPALKQLHDDPDRLRQPMIRRGATWERVALGRGVRRDRPPAAAASSATHGRDAVAVYLGNPSAHNPRR